MWPSSLALFETTVKRAAVTETSSEAVAKAAQVRPESNYDGFVITSLMAQLTPDRV
jgi:hypothetical protein